MMFSKEVPYTEKLNFIIYIFSRLTLNLGSLIYTFAVSYSILYFTGSALYFSINLAISSVVMTLMLPLSGVMSDLGNKRRIIISGEILLTLIMGGLLLFTYLYGFNIYAIYLTSFLTALVNPFVSNSFQTSMTEMFHKERIQKVMGYVSAIMSSAIIIGPALGGVLFGLFDFYVMILIFFITYAVSTLLDFLIKFDLYYNPDDYELNNDTAPASSTVIGKFKHDVWQGIKYIKDSYVFLRVFIMAAFINFFASLMGIYPEKAMITELKFEAETVGIINAFDGIGVLIAGIIIGSVKQFKNPVGLMKTSLLIWTFTIPLYLLPLYSSLSDTYSIVFFAAMGFSIAVLLQVINVPLFTYIQLAVPQYIKGRVFSTMGLFASSIVPVGTLLYGFAYDNLPYWIIHSISFIALITVTLTFLNKRVIEESKADVIKVSKEIDISNDLHENANI
ncbi:Transmembrane secretion effector [Jeotgalicoccus aerolatus]|uniref:Transmembrane secretion effector n=1 Tax=Jeotgalicoccus aerolatus TaxID=709510 RepID=A0A1G9CPG4_9STAP|nr:MFS transporter [Jeotgalicoccus aerolatus]SDK53590.1 Transmembrane secretion effector [Jeotgalicoccus aerolatus]